MSHGMDYYSHGNIPFSWEDKPGVSKSSKVTHFDADDDVSSSEILVQDQKVPPPPPCSIRLPSRRSNSVKSLRGWWEEDPFLEAYKVCTKSGGNDKSLSSEGMKGGCAKLLLRRKKMSFSCKKCSDVKEKNLVNLSKPPPIPN